MERERLAVELWSPSSPLSVTHLLSIQFLVGAFLRLQTAKGPAGIHMLKTASQGQRAEGKKAKFDVEIASVATAAGTENLPSRDYQARERSFSASRAARKPLWQYRD